MGTLDTNGTVNVYFEDSTFKDHGAGPDADARSRVVIRYSVLDGVWGFTHGYTSEAPARHFEHYNNVFRSTTFNRNLAGRYFWIRSGTAVFTDNEVNGATYPFEWGNPVLTDIGDNTLPQRYPQSFQPGWGHNGSTDVRDPIYVWNQTGTRAYTWGVGHGWDSNVQLNREIFVNSGAKPGYSKYTYPHPLRGGSGSGSPPVSPPAASALSAPSNLRIVQ